jgi:hypothetical protein
LLLDINTIADLAELAIQKRHDERKVAFANFGMHVFELHLGVGHVHHYYGA